jgi:hypothetical protein
MRRIDKPAAPALPGSSYGEYALALSNSPGVGRYCSFCEKALNQQLLLFHKRAGMVPTAAQLSAADWPDLLLICGDCASAAVSFDPHAAYYWPDTPLAGQAPFVYRLVDGVTLKALGPEGAVIDTKTVSVVLVHVATDIDATLRNAAGLTLHLFQLNGRFFNDNASAPGYDFPYDEYVEASDHRVHQRLDACTRAKEIAAVLGEFLQESDVTAGDIQAVMKLMNGAIAGFGFLSTWEMVVQSTLATLTPDPRPKLFQLLSETPKPIEPLPDRKRCYEEFQQGVDKAPKVVQTKRMRHDDRMRMIIGES